MPKAYITSTCCGSKCHRAFDATEEKPCWGEIHAVDEQCWENDDGSSDYEWIHGCDGHWEYDGYDEPPPGFLEKTKPTPEFEY